MNDFFEFISNQANNSFIFFVLGCLFTIFCSYAFFKLSIINIKLTYHSRNETIIDKNNLIQDDNFQIIYKDHKLNTLLKSTVYIWNSGKKTITKQELVSKDKLRIEFKCPDIQIYMSNIEKNSDKANGMRLISTTNNIIELDFDYLEPKDGIRIEILHNKIDELPELKGKVLGTKKIENSDETLGSKILTLADGLGVISLYFLLFFISFVILVFSINMYSNIVKNNLFMLFCLFIVIILPAVISPWALKYISKSKNYPSKLDNK